MSVGKAGHYFKSDDYYLSEKGEWQGKAAEALGLRGEVGNEDFKAVLRGHDPRTGELLVDGRTDRVSGAGKRRGGVDLTFSAPKSVSILALADGRIKEAHEAAVSAVMEFVERHHGHAREQEDGGWEVVTTGNLAVAKFTHMVSRASGGEVLPDPQLHTHAFVVNLTQKEDGVWRAHHNDALYRDQLALGRFYRAELARNLRELGYGIEVTEPRSFLWEIRGVPGEVLGEFSKRRQQILERAEELRATGDFPKAGETTLREIANRDTRLPKGKVSRKVLLEQWSGTLREMGHALEGLRDEALRAGREELDRENRSAPEWVLTAARIRTETESVFTREDVLDLAARISRGAAGFRELDRALTDLSREGHVPFLGTLHVPGRSGRTLPREAFTTPEMQAMETDVLRLAQASKGTWAPIASHVLVADRVAETEAAQAWRFTREQTQAVQTILTSPDRVNLVQGDAGTGKTAALALVREVAEQRGVRVLGLGFTGKAAQELADGAGIPSKTLDSFLHSARAQDLPPGNLLVVDEASMAGSRHFHRLLTLTRERDWKAVLVGDTKQFPSIAAGRNHALLQERPGVDTVHLTEVVRQETEHARAVVGALSCGDTDRALRELRDRKAL
jgi:conjugative relaxase-like TrwC/TraI family protein